MPLYHIITFSPLASTHPAHASNLRILGDFSNGNKKETSRISYHFEIKLTSLNFREHVVLNGR